MPSFDEATLRKAAAWQDFKEAQGLYNTGAVLNSESTPDGYQGSLKIGTRTYRTSVVARTPTWFDAKCPCPRNQREGAFCPHAIAVGLHLLSPPQPVATKTNSHPSTAIPDLAWKIRFQGPWQNALAKGHSSICLSSSDHPPTPTDRRITAWLISQKQTYGSTVQLALNNQNLAEFLTLARNHPQISSPDGSLSIETRAQLRISNCTISGEAIQLIPGSDNISKIGDTFWNVSPTSIAQIGNSKPSPTLLPILSSIAARKPASIEIPAFLRELDQIQVFIDFTASAWFESLQFISAEPTFQLTLSGSDSRLQATFHTSYSQSVPCLDGTRLISRNSHAENHARTLISQFLQPISDTSFELTNPEKIREFLTLQIPKLPAHWQVELSPSIQKLASSYQIISPHIEILSSSDDSLDFHLSFKNESGETIPATEIRRLLRSKNSPSNQRIILSDDIENLIDPIFEDLDLQQQNGRFTAGRADAEIIREIANILKPSTFPDNQEICSQVIHNHSLNVTLRPYQISGFSWLVDRITKFGGALLADDMGLGKTLQTIACIERFFSTYSQPSPVLVVVTTSLLGNWKAEFERFAPGRRVIILHGTQRDHLREKIEANPKQPEIIKTIRCVGYRMERLQ